MPRESDVDTPLRAPVGPLAYDAYCGKNITFFENVPVGPGQNKDSTNAINVDGYHYLHVWVQAQTPGNLAMDNVTVQCVFEMPKVGATGLADLSNPYSVTNKPVPIQTNSGPPAGGFGSFVLRVPVIGPAVRVIVLNNGVANTYNFSVYGYLTR